MTRAPDPFHRRTTDAGWVPASPCAESCTRAGPRADHPRPAWRAAVRGAGLVVVLVAAVLTAPLLVLLPRRTRVSWLRLTARAVLAAAGVAVRLPAGAAGAFGPGGVLVVANHLSWIEALALAGAAPVRLLAKREIRGWPVVGAVAGATGALFIDRRGLRRLPQAVAELSATLRAGAAVVAFPEGTTWCGAAGGRFRRAAFQAALDAGVPVRPVAVRLRRAGRTAPEAAFVGQQSLLGSVVRVLRMTAVVCELIPLPAIAPEGDRAALAARASAAIATATGVPPPVRGRPADGRPAVAA